VDSHRYFCARRLQLESTVIKTIAMPTRPTKRLTIQIELAQTAQETSSVQLGLATSSAAGTRPDRGGLAGKRGILAATPVKSAKIKCNRACLRIPPATGNCKRWRSNPSAQHSTIEYFSKDVDREVVAKALVEGGLKFSNATAAKIIDDPTNSIWAGDKVPLLTLGSSL